MDVDRILRELMNPRAHGAPGAALVVLAEHAVGLETAMESLRALKAHGCPLVLWVPADLAVPEWRRRLSSAVGGCGFTDALPLEAAEALMYGCVFFPVLTPGMARALADGDERDPRVRAGILALLVGRPVAALAAGADPSHPEWRKAGLRAPDPWIDGWQETLRRLRRVGVRLLRAPDETAAWMEGWASPALIDEEAVRSARARGDGVIPVGPRTVITPLARERARAWGITFRTKGPS